jgi:choline dehydrogenase-like flavoprotein
MLDSDAYDVVVIGAGAGGMTAAAVAAAEGLSVLVIEKTEFVGGTTAWSGGMIWIPVNAGMKQAGLPDSLSDAVDYLAGTVPEPDNADLRDIFLSRGPEAVDYLEVNTEIRLQPVKAYPDYYPDMPGATAGGRVLEPVTFDGTRLGANFARLRPPLPEFTLLGGMMVNRSDIPHLRKFGRSLRSTLRSLRLISHYALQRLRSPRGTTLHLGNALAARLYASLLARNVEILFGTGVERLLIDGDAVRGVRITGSSGARSIAARRAWCWRREASRMMQAFAGSSLPLPPVQSPPRLPPERETACGSRWQAAPASVRESRTQPIGCPRPCFDGRMAARAYSRIP